MLVQNNYTNPELPLKIKIEAVGIRGSSLL